MIRMSQECILGYKISYHFIKLQIDEIQLVLISSLKSETEISICDNFVEK